jgi:hypothetical protein
MASNGLSIRREVSFLLPARTVRLCGCLSRTESLPGRFAESGLVKQNHGLLPESRMSWSAICSFERWEVGEDW